MDFRLLKPLPAPVRGFPVAEFEARLANMQQAMGKSSFDLMLLTTEPEIYWLTGLQTPAWQSAAMPWYLLVPQSGQAVAIIPSLGVPCMRNTWIEDIRHWSPTHVHDDSVALLASTIYEMAGEKPIIGLAQGDRSHLRMPLADFIRLGREIAAEWRDATSLIETLHAIKSEREIVKIEHAAEIASHAFEQVPQFAGRGMSEIEIFRNFKMACLAFGCDDTAYLAGGAGTGGYEDIISPPARRTLSMGDVLMIDAGCRWDGYICDFNRNFVMGEPDEEVTEAYRIVHEALEAGIAAARPGKSCGEIYQTMHQILAPHMDESLNNTVPFGHGLGMQLVEFPVITASEDTLLEPDMVFTLSPGLAYASSRMMVLEVNIVIRQAGAQLLSANAPQQIPALD
jgi:Xaa-Pro dipeptidase